MTTFADLTASIKDEIFSRYKSPIWGAAILALIGVHWKIAIFLLLDKPTATEAFLFIQANCNWQSITLAIGFAAMYVIVFPWFELGLSRLASYGIRYRNNFQIREREKEIAIRKIIALQEATATELELKNKEDQSRISDIELARNYQSTLSGENFSRWLKDAEQGAINSSLNNSIVNYLGKVDSIEGRFIDQHVEKAHEKFIAAISLLNSTLNDSRATADEGKKSDLVKATRAAHVALQEYRKEVRERLGI